MTSTPVEMSNEFDKSSATADKIAVAARHLADLPRNPVPVLPALQRDFGLTLDEAHEAVVLAGRMRMLRRAFA